MSPLFLSGAASEVGIAEEAEIVVELCCGVRVNGRAVDELVLVRAGIIACLGMSASTSTTSPP